MRAVRLAPQAMGEAVLPTDAAPELRAIAG
jgi:hypothetical protein